LFLQIERAGQRDVPVQMALVKFVENEDGHAFQSGIIEHLPQQNAFGYKPDFGPRRRDIFEADLVTDLFAELHVQFLRNAGREQSCGEPARLKHHHLAGAQEIVPEQHLGHLGGFAGAGGRGQNQPPAGFQPGDNVAFDVVDGQTVGHVPPIVTGRMSLAPRKIRPRVMHFARLEDDGFVERLVLPAIAFADENPQQQGFVWNLHVNCLSLN
jgi:hypothetical protein